MPTKPGSQYARCSLRMAAMLSLTFLAFLSCGNNHGSRFTPRAAASLQSALAEIEALQVPSGVDAQVMSQLKQSLMAALEERFNREGKITANVPHGDANKVDDLAFIQINALEWKLTWTYKNVGDYNQDGIVKIDDITQIALKYNQDATTPDVQVADGDGSGKITVADVTPIAMHWYEEIAHYRVESCAAFSSTWTEVSTIDLSQGTRPDGGKLLFSFAFTPIERLWYRVVPVDNSGDDGVVAWSVNFFPPYSIPNATDITPKEGYAGESVTFSATVTGEEPITYSWEFDGAGTPETSSEVSPTITLGESGIHHGAILHLSNRWANVNVYFTIKVRGVPDALTVGYQWNYTTIEAAYADAVAGDTIEVYPQLNDAPYSQVALLLKKPSLTIVGMDTSGDGRISINGTGYEYSGAGSVPRAVFQFDPEASGCTVSNFNIYEAHNTSYNGAGFRINQADNVTISNCEIRDCDMGIMSNATAADPGKAKNQQIINCKIRNNGNLDDPGYNHNLYLGGYSVMVKGCEIYNSLTGHNYKSRARYNLIEGCYIHDSANREVDIVDDANETVTPGADAVIISSVIVKDKDCLGNRNTIHYGQDVGGSRAGTLYIINCIIATPFYTPVVDLNSPGTSVQYYNTLLYDMNYAQSTGLLTWDFGGTAPITVNTTAATANFTLVKDVPGRGSLIDFMAPSSPPANWLYTAPVAPWVDAPSTSLTGLTLLTGSGLPNPLADFCQYSYPLGTLLRTDIATPDIGAFEVTG